MVPPSPISRSSGWGPKTSRSTGSSVRVSLGAEGAQHLADELIECALTNPADDDHQIVLPVDIDDVAAIALERHRACRRVRKCRLRARVEEPVHVTVAVVGRSGRTRHVDPFLRDDLAIVPFAVAQEQIAEAGHVARRDEHAAAPVPAASHRLQPPSVDVDPRVLVAIPAPRTRRADRLHDLLAQVFGQRPAQHVQGGEREHVDARVVVLVTRARLAQLAIRPIGRRLALGPIGPVGLAPDRSLPVARLAKQVLPRDLELCGPSNSAAASPGGM